jgi:ADP-heptose:LPS heptosyltransferase
MSARHGPTGAPVVRVLIIKRDKLGDLLLTTPVFARLAAMLPDAEIHLLANDYNAWVARGHPALARIWVYRRARSGGRLDPWAALRQIPLARALRRERFDWAFVMGGDESHRGIRRALAVRARRVVAYANEPARYGRGLTDAAPPPTHGHETARMLALLTPLTAGGTTLDALAQAVATNIAVDAPTFALSPGAATFAREWLGERALARDGYVVIGLGARRTKKQPTADQVERWSTRILREHNLATVIVWTPGAATSAAYPGDDALAQQILARGLAHVHPFRGPIEQAVALMFDARTSIVPDSGLMHFAAASPGGVLGLFADPLDSAPASRWAPIGARARHIEAPRLVRELADDQIFSLIDPLLAVPAVRGDGEPMHASL